MNIFTDNLESIAMQYAEARFEHRGGADMRRLEVGLLNELASIGAELNHEQAMHAYRQTDKFRQERAQLQALGVIDADS